MAEAGSARMRTGRAKLRPVHGDTPSGGDVEDCIASFEGRVLAEDERVPMIAPNAVAANYCAPALKAHFEGREVEVGDDLLVRYLAQAPGGVRVARFLYPDVFVAKGVRRRPGRRQYDAEAEGKGPDFVLEVLSRGTLENDTVVKPSAYAALGVKEYFLFDPTGALPVPTLHGYRLSRDSAPRRLREASLPNGKRGLYSEELGLYAYVLNGRVPPSRAEDEPLVEMRWHDPAAGADLPSLRESMDRARREAAKAERESTRADQESANAERESTRADQESARADRESAKAQQEAAARRVAERKIAELERRLARAR